MGKIVSPKAGFLRLSLKPGSTRHVVSSPAQKTALPLQLGAVNPGVPPIPPPSSTFSSLSMGSDISKRYILPHVSPTYAKSRYPSAFISTTAGLLGISHIKFASSFTSNLNTISPVAISTA